MEVEPERSLVVVKRDGKDGPKIELEMDCDYVIGRSLKHTHDCSTALGARKIFDRVCIGLTNATFALTFPPSRACMHVWNTALMARCRQYTKHSNPHFFLPRCGSNK